MVLQQLIKSFILPLQLKITTGQLSCCLCEERSWVVFNSFDDSPTTICHTGEDNSKTSGVFIGIVRLKALWLNEGTLSYS